MDIRRAALIKLIGMMRREPYSKYAGNMRYMNAVYRKLVNDLGGSWRRNNGLLANRK